MANYKTSQDISRKNFGGINANATVLNINDPEAESIVNWDISDRGSIQKRLGIVPSASNPGNGTIKGYTRFLSNEYVQKYAALCDTTSTTGYTLWESDTPTGTWTERYGSAAMADAGTPIMAGWLGKLFVANGENPPLVMESGNNAETIEDASLVPPPTTISVTSTTAAGATSLYYCVTSVTGRGESVGSPSAYTGLNASTAKAGLNGATDYNTINWIPIDGCSSQRVYLFDSVHWRLIAEVSPTTSSYIDGSPNYLDIAGVQHYTPGVTTAYNTPNDWNTNGYPKGFAIVAKGTDERMFAWRGSTIWASALRNGLNWFQANDAFAFTVTGGEDNEVTGVVSLHDYTVIFSRTNSFIYTGASATTINLTKIVPIGCLSHNSIVYAKGDVYFWSEYGPTSLQRIMAGADVYVTSKFNDKIWPIIYNDTDTSQWDKIHGYADIKNNRIVWSVASPTSEAGHDLGIIFQFDVDGFTTYDGWYVDYGVQSNDFSISGIYRNARIATLNSGYSDDGAAINAVYKTPHYDMRSWAPKKRVPYIDVLANKSLGSYNVGVSWTFDYGEYDSNTVTLTESSTDGSPLNVTSTTTVPHRVYMDGVGNAFQMTFTSDNTLPAEIIGWRPTVSFKGQR